MGVDLGVNPKNANPKKVIQGGHVGPPEQNTETVNPSKLGKIIQWFKTMITNEYIENVKSHNWEAFNKRLFQRNYYEHIIRNNESLNQIRHYIFTNQDRWEKDIENPKNIHEKVRVITIKDSMIDSYYKSIIKRY